MSLALAGATLGAGLLSTAGSVYSNTINSAAQQAINDRNVQLQYDINASQLAAAAYNNQTAIDLANTAHQREVRDLRDANLNPILSAHSNGSAVPALDTPGLEAPNLQASTIDNPLAGLASTLQTAVQVSDAHALNEARLGLMGYGEQSKKSVMSGGVVYDGHSPQAINTLNSAKAFDALTLDLERIGLERDKIANDRMQEELRTHVLYSYLRGSDDDIDKVQSLAREGFLSDLKLRANANFRAGLSSAKQVSDAASDWFGLSRKGGKR